MTDSFVFDLEEFLFDIHLFDQSGDRSLYIGKTLAGFRVRVDPKQYEQLPFLYEGMTV
jgi:hypothetical protein